MCACVFMRMFVCVFVLTCMWCVSIWVCVCACVHVCDRCVCVWDVYMCMMWVYVYVCVFCICVFVCVCVRDAYTGMTCVYVYVCVTRCSWRATAAVRLRWRCWRRDTSWTPASRTTSCLRDASWRRPTAPSPSGQGPARRGGGGLVEVVRAGTTRSGWGARRGG